jgi:hypothetical protein
MRRLHSKVVQIPVVIIALLSLPPRGMPQPAANASPFPFAYVQKGCGETDAVVTEFYFTTKQSHGGKYEEPFLLIALNDDLSKSAPKRYSIKSGTRAVLASRCLKPASCEASTSGFLYLSRFRPGVGASGDYELHFQNGSSEKGHFDATWYHNHFLCG